MKLTKQTNYAIRILMYCAANEGRLSKVQDIASAYDMPTAFLFKLAQPITKHGFLESVRGPNGGVRLAKQAKDIKLSEVIRVTEDNFDMAECFKEDGTDCPLVDACELNLVLREALNAFFGALDKYTIADLANNRYGIEQLLGIDRLNKSMN